MNSTNTIDALNRLYVILFRSLPMYLHYAPPWTHRGDERAMEVLQQLAADQQRTVDRLAELILELKGDVDSGEFPMSFTGLHDLSVEYIVGLAIEYQRRDIASIEACVDQLRTFPFAKALAEEALGEAKGHLDSLEELQPSSVA